MDIITLILVYAAGVATPYLKKIITKIIVKGYTKLDAQVDRWE